MPLSTISALPMHSLCVQAIWVAAVAVALPVALHKKWLKIPNAHVEILAGAAAIGSVIAELFMIKSLVVFDPKISADPVLNGHEEPASPRYSRSRVRISVETSVQTSLARGLHDVGRGCSVCWDGHCSVSCGRTGPHFTH